MVALKPCNTFNPTYFDSARHFFKVVQSAQNSNIFGILWKSMDVNQIKARHLFCLGFPWMNYHIFHADRRYMHFTTVV